MNKPPVFFFFILALCAFALEPFHSIRLFAFTPLLAIAFQRTSFLASLWIAASLGFLIDLFTSDIRFGLFALSYALTAACTHRFRLHFFEENLISIPLYTLLISTLLSLVQFFLILPINTFSFPFIITSFLLMPLMDAVLAFVWFTCPLFLYHLVTQRQPRRL